MYKLQTVIFSTIFICFTTITYGQLKVTSAGQVQSVGNFAIGTVPSSTYVLDVYPGAQNRMTRFRSSSVSHLLINPSGGYYGPAIQPSTNNTGNVGTSDKVFKYIWCYDLTETSDKRQKENIREIQNPLELVLKMQGVKYDWKKEYFYPDSIKINQKVKEKLEKDRKDHYGFIAQDLEKIAPELIIHDDSTDIYGITYSKAIPILVEAIKELNAKIELLKGNSGKAKSAEESYNLQHTKAALEQNMPNPFTEQTIINFHLGENTHTANLFIYDLSGTQLKSIPIHQTGYGSITIEGSELQAGIYYYTLVADNQVIGSKQMILTK